MPLVPILLVVHVTLAVALLLPSVLLPFALRVGRRVGPEGDARPAAPVRLSGPARFLVELHARGSTPLAGGLALTGLGLLAALGPE
ncbi:MAG TPA: hypothetical protein VIV06_09485, partial [Candidatus Limnocylindrales bacterium]